MRRFIDLIHPIKLLKEELLARADAEKRIDGLSETVLYHAYKSLVATDQSLFTYWADELRDYYRHLNKIELKPRGKKPTFKMFYELLYNQMQCNPENSLSARVFKGLAEKAQKENKAGLDFSTTHEVLKRPMYVFYSQFCTSLSKNETDEFIPKLLLTLKESYRLPNMTKLRYRLHELLHPISYIKWELTARAEAERKIADCAERLFIFVDWALMEDVEETFKEYAHEIESFFFLLDGIFLRFGAKPSYRTFYNLLYKKPYTTGWTAEIDDINTFYKKFCRALSEEDKDIPNEFVLDWLLTIKNAK